MFTEKFQHIAIAAIGAMILTTVSVGAAVGPARTAELAPVQVAAQNA